MPSLHLIGSKDDMAESDGAKIARSCTGPAQLRMVKGAGHLGLAEGKSFVNGIIGADSDKRVQHATRILASAFFIRHLTDADQLADEMENKVTRHHDRGPAGSRPGRPTRSGRRGRGRDDLI